ncbi:mrna guanylyltransferase [Phaffia rhodozyma]|uniref:mRNA-capping enzyme subunit alpha n=1 Tax=Phaffia rhodozyma TaxID=264483 RepID=A0A0F7SQ23_PHARH|nr:mrna guanylyltransferase [Phaffia rhodozyma]
MPASTTRIPEIPGKLVTPEQTAFLNEHVMDLCGLKIPKFPGSQPVSFTQASLSLLEQEDFWVCEKSDGVRVLVLIAWNKIKGAQDVFLIDRKEEFRQVEGLVFPNGEDPARRPLEKTLLDGELVLDVDAQTGKETLRLYAFDCLVFSGISLLKKSLMSRYGRLQKWVIGPLDKLPPSSNKPFEIVCKKMNRAYGVEDVFKVDIPKLQHGHDGLIFTACDSGYTVGTDPNILKWKPASENSIDFKLELRFPALDANPSQPDFEAMPIFKLYQWLGDDRYEFFDGMVVEPDEWERMKESKIQYDDAVVEVTWLEDRQTWSIMRVRDDKIHGNHASIVQKVLVSIMDGVEAEELFKFAPHIKKAWKAREAGHITKPQPPSLSSSNPGYSGGGGGHNQYNQQKQGYQSYQQQPQQGQYGYPNQPTMGGGGGAVFGGLKR